MSRNVFDRLIAYGAAAWLFAVAVPAPGVVSAGEADCGQCHADVGKGPVEHKAVLMGCAACHGALDATTVPHRTAAPAARGLTASQPELCYGCHDRNIFDKKNVHAAARSGCTSCHEPHAAKHRHLLKSPPPDLCFSCHGRADFSGKFAHGPSGAGFCTLCHSPHASGNRHLLKLRQPDLCFSCHDRADFSGKFAHGPSGAGFCTTCHSPHASDVKTAILRRTPLKTCLYCHEEFTRGRHLLTGLQSNGHPYGLPVKKRGKKRLKDPLRKGRLFYCGGCHDPHSSDSTFMVRFTFSSPYDICVNCHR